MRVLPDSSIWIGYFGRGEDAASWSLVGLIGQRSAMACVPMVAEVLAGTRPERREEAWAAFSALDWAELDRPAWAEAGETGHELRRRGGTVTLVDVAIAVAALRAGTSVWTHDRDFETIRDVLPELDLYRP
jgi:predicted nucleic acid-binding protein